MNFSRTFTLLLFIFWGVFMPFFVRADLTTSQIDNVGFIETNIWYSKLSPEEGETVKIYSALWNGSDKTIEGRVVFYDKEIILAEKPFVVEGSSVKVISADWKVSIGEHIIKAKIIESQFVGGNKELVDLSLDTSVTPEIKTVIKKKIVPEINSENINKGDEGASSTDLINTSKILGKAGDFFATGTPKKVADSVASVVVKVDNMREKQYQKIQNKLENIPEEDNYKRLFWNSLGYFFNNRFLFYIVLALVVGGAIKLIRNRSNK